MNYKVEDKPAEKKEDKAEKVEVEETLPPQELDPIQVEARALQTWDVFKKSLDKEEILKNVKERREEREKWEEDRRKKAEKAEKKDKS